MRYKHKTKQNMFFVYVRNKRKAKGSIGPLWGESGDVVMDDGDKLEILKN